MSGCGSSSREAFCDLGSARRCHLGRFPGYSSRFEGGALRLLARFARCSFCGVCGEVCRLGGRLVEALFQRGCRAACVVSISPAHKCCSADDCRNTRPREHEHGNSRCRKCTSCRDLRYAFRFLCERRFAFHGKNLRNHDLAFCRRCVCCCVLGHFGSFTRLRAKDSGTASEIVYLKRIRCRVSPSRPRQPTPSRFRYAMFRRQRSGQLWDKKCRFRGVDLQIVPPKRGGRRRVGLSEPRNRAIAEPRTPLKRHFLSQLREICCRETGFLCRMGVLVEWMPGNSIAALPARFLVEHRHASWKSTFAQVVCLCEIASPRFDSSCACAILLATYMDSSKTSCR